MIIYVEKVFIENFIITFILLKSICLIYKFKQKLTYLVIASFLGGLYALVYPNLPINGILLLIFKMICGYTIVFTCFYKYKLKKQLVYYLTFIVMTALYGGLTIGLNFCFDKTGQRSLPLAFILFVILISYYFVNQLLKVYNKTKSIQQFIFEVTLTNGKYKVKTKGYLDSGNVLFDSKSQKTVLIVNYNLFNKICNVPLADLLMKNTKDLKNAHYINYTTASSTGSMLVFEIDDIKIKVNNNFKTLDNAILGLSLKKINGGYDYEMLLPASVL